MTCLKHTTSNQPSITFTNFHQHDVVGYPLIVLKGIISNGTNADISDINIINNNENVVENCSIARNGEFKAIIRLSDGANDIKLRYCCISQSITINFRRKCQPKHLVKVFYIICTDHNGHFQCANDESTNSIESACEKINVAMTLVQCLYAEMLHGAEFERKTFEFLECQPFHSKLHLNEARQWSPNQLWHYHAKEVLCAESDTKAVYKYIGILACTTYSNGAVKGNAALGIGDFALIGGGTLFAWPDNIESIKKSFENDTPIDKHNVFDDSNGRGTFGGCFSTALGTICHEIGHIFDLGHTSDGIMGSDIDYVHRIFIHERYPRNLPKRFTCTAKQMVPMTVATTTMPRITSIRTTNTFLSTYRQRNASDLTFFMVNCAVLLSSHKWFNQWDCIDYVIDWDVSQRLIWSRWPLVFVEIRRYIDGMCMEYRRFDLAENCMEFRVSSKYLDGCFELIALDQYGNCEKFALK